MVSAVAANTPDAIELMKIREKLGLTIRKFAERLGHPETRYKNWEYGLTRKVPAEVLESARMMLAGVTPRQNVTRNISGTPMALIPVIGAASAGPGISNVDPDTYGIWVPMSLANLGGVGYVVEGDSMMPALEPGDIALFREDRQPRRGRTYLLDFEGEKRVKNLAWKDGRWMLESLNPSFQDEPLDGHQILGYLIGWYKVRGSRETLDSDPNGLQLEK